MCSAVCERGTRLQSVPPFARPLHRCEHPPRLTFPMIAPLPILLKKSPPSPPPALSPPSSAPPPPLKSTLNSSNPALMCSTSVSPPSSESRMLTASFSLLFIVS